MPPSSADNIPARSANRSARTIVVGFLALAALVLVGREAASRLDAFALWVQSLGPAGPLVFVAGYAAAVVAFVPASLLTLAAGAVFGLAHGVAYVFVAATLGSTAAFLVARYLARSLVEQRLAGNPRFAAVDRAVGRDGRRIVFLLRLSPAFPFTLLNYALGLTGIGLVDYIVASVGMLPGTFLYVYYGKLAGDVAKLAAGGGAQAGGWGYWSVAAAGLAATVAVTTVVARTARRALAEATDVEGTRD